MKTTTGVKTQCGAFDHIIVHNPWKTPCVFNKTSQMSGMGFDELNCNSTWEAYKLSAFVVLVYKTKVFELLN